VKRFANSTPWAPRILAQIDRPKLDATVVSAPVDPLEPGPVPVPKISVIPAEGGTPAQEFGDTASASKNADSVHREAGDTSSTASSTPIAPPLLPTEPRPIRASLLLCRPRARSLV